MGGQDREGPAACPLRTRCHVRQMGGVTRLWHGWLLLCCLPAGRESRRRCQGASPLQLGPWPAGLLGNQESQAQLIKLWAVAVQDRSGTQYPWKPRPAALSLHRALPQGRPVRARSAWGRSSEV